MRRVANLVRPKGDPKIIETGPSSVYLEDRLAKYLGWFSIGLGVAEILAPRRLTRALGMQGMEPLVRAFGAREIASGMTTLSTEKGAGLGARLAGDALDLATLSKGLSAMNLKRGNVKLAMLAVLAVTALDALAASAVAARKKRSSTPRSYSDRSGFPKDVETTARSPDRKKAALGA